MVMRQSEAMQLTRKRQMELEIKVVSYSNSPLNSKLEEQKYETK